MKTFQSIMMAALGVAIGVTVGMTIYDQLKKRMS